MKMVIMMESPRVYRVPSAIKELMARKFLTEYKEALVLSLPPEIDQAARAETTLTVSVDDITLSENLVDTDEKAVFKYLKADTVFRTDGGTIGYVLEDHRLDRRPWLTILWLSVDGSVTPARALLDESVYADVTTIGKGLNFFKKCVADRQGGAQV